MNASRLLAAPRHLARSPEIWRCARACHGWPRIAASYLGLSPNPFPIDFQVRSGVHLTLETFADLATAWLIWFRREYPVDPSWRHIIDAGANIGAFSTFATTYAPAARVVAIEPFPATFNRLTAHIEENGLTDRVTCLPVALAGAHGHRRMSAAPIGSQFRALEPDGVDAGVAVEAIPFGELLERAEMDRVDLLKIDIEGSEYELLAAASDAELRRVGTVALEYHPSGDPQTLFTRLAAAGFRLSRHTPAASGYGTALLTRRD